MNKISVFAVREFIEYVNSKTCMQDAVMVWLQVVALGQHFRPKESACYLDAF